MKAFRFSLRSVATVRAHAEFRAREAFAAAIRAQAGAAGRHAAAQARLAALEQAIHASRRHGCIAGGAVTQLRAYRHACDGAAAAAQELNAAREGMHRRREAYLEAHRQAQLMDRAEQRARAAHRAATARAEQAELDDRSGRNGRSPRFHP